MEHLGPGETACFFIARRYEKRGYNYSTDTDLKKELKAISVVDIRKLNPREEYFVLNGAIGFVLGIHVTLFVPLRLQIKNHLVLDTEISVIGYG